MLRLIKNKGFHITFDNNVTVSVQMGGGNYCDNYDWTIAKHTCVIAPPSSCVEIMCWRNIDNKPDEVFRKQWHNYINNKGGVIGWANMNKLLETLNWAAKYEDKH